VTTTQDVTTPVLELHQVSKTFGAVEALRKVDLRVNAGEVVGLVGDNGAGKSTLIKTIGGVHSPDGGRVLVDGLEHPHLTARLAQRLGIETIHQNLALVDNLDVAGNIFINRELVQRNPLGRALGWLDKRGMNHEITSALAAFQLPPATLGRPVKQLSGGQRQMIAIARALYWKPRLVMMDEPTAALAVAHATRVLELVKTLADTGIGVLFVSHDMQHVLQVTDRVAVLRHGVKVADIATPSTSHQEIVMYITGHRATPPPPDSTEARS